MSLIFLKRSENSRLVYIFLPLPRLSVCPLLLHGLYPLPPSLPHPFACFAHLIMQLSVFLLYTKFPEGRNPVTSSAMLNVS